MLTVLTVFPVIIKSKEALIMSKRRIFIVLFSLVLFCLSGCANYEPGWKKLPKATAAGDVKALTEKSDKMVKEADSKEKLLELIKINEEIVAIEPANFKALTALGNYLFLLGFAYTPDIAEKSKLYTRAVEYSEMAMYTNRGFAELVDKGESIYEASSALTEREMEPMFYWYCAGGQRWTHCLGLWGKIANFRIPAKSKIVLNRMAAIDENWHRGQVMFCYATLYTIPPAIFGGDMKKGKEYFDKAVALGPDCANHFVIRAKYYQTKSKDKEAFKKDLEQAISIDPARSSSPYPWSAYYHEEAKRMLEHMNDYF